ncbi:o-succinylbenzoate synthase [Fodinisporobacter ferrooxydans]|uniref:o-succinylbenzoate synthase n=1 Tax=Fodinisporobacter ferrooxydans TaxID=2901836 RepID=A0ABY4CJZ8_9BACL|nr:o-succinylbenzoate synthase [Alicyclobacillaceae bacterium MYW30-H2]
MRIERIELQLLKMPLKSPFTTSFGSLWEKHFILVSAHGEGVTGYGESTAMPFPFYNEETTDTVWYMLENFLIPALRHVELFHPDELEPVFANIRRNFMAKAALEGAIWDLYCKQQGIPLSRALGGTKTEIAVGVSIGIQPTTKQLLETVEKHLAEGYKKIKIKIKPGYDVEPIRAIRKQFGADVPLMADANSAYSLDDVPLLQQLDEYGLLMIEQPLSHDDIIDHARLQAQLQTPICLDESIHTVADARKAVELCSCKIINIKIGRVGGLTAAKRIHDYCQEQNVPVWCGGMLEAGVGRAHNIAITSLSNFSIPGDTSASNRYWQEDLVEPAIDFVRPGYLAVPGRAGIGYTLRPQVIQKYLLKEQSATLA